MSHPASHRKPLDYIPHDILCAHDYESLARHFMAVPTQSYIAGGCGRDLTVDLNRMAFERRRILPRLLNAMAEGHTRLRLFGRVMPHPILLAPVAYQTLVHQDGEVETARAAAATDTTLVVSTLASRLLETVVAVPGLDAWFQLYFQPDRSATRDLVYRAETAGYHAIVVTLDATIKTPSLRAERAGFEMPGDVKAVNLSNYGTAPGVKIGPGESRIFQGIMRQAPTWDDVAWLLTQTRLPLIVKGVQHPEDARQLKAMGVAGLIVSNHGGRALDGAPASLDTLPAIRRAVGDDFPVLLDSGIRSGSDVFKAIALGANAVLVGRLQSYALAVAGALGVAHLMKLLREELELCMAQAGCATLAEIGPDRIFNETHRQEMPC